MLRLWKSLRSSWSGRENRLAPPPLRILRLERRRLLSADFALAATGLVLDGFDGARDLSIAEADGEYLFTLDQGAWRTAPDGEVPDGVQIDGQTLRVDKLAINPLADGVTVVAGDAAPLNVTFVGADFSGLVGGLTLDGIASINQPPATPSLPGIDGSAPGGLTSAALADPPSLTIGSFDFGGDLNLLVNGSVGDGPNSQITVGGDLTITSRPFGGVAGIELADGLGDLLSVGGRATFEAQTADASSRFDIHVGVGDGTAFFDSLSVFGGKATVVESDGGTADGTVLDDSNVTSFNLTSAGAIADANTASIEVAGNAAFTATDPLDNSITLDATFNSGTLTFDGGAVQIAEASGVELTGDNQAETLDLDAVGSISDAAGTTLDVAGLADFESTTGDAITLDETHTFGTLRFFGGDVAIDEAAGGSADGTELAGDSVANTLALTSAGPINDSAGGTASLTVLGNAQFITTPLADITLDDTNNFGTLTFTGAGVTIVEQSGTILAGGSIAATLDLTSGGSITDLGSADVNVAGLASFDSTTDAAITLDATHRFGQLRFDGGAVAISEAAGGSADGTDLAGASQATSLTLTSDGPITDAVGALLAVDGFAFFNSTPGDAVTLNGDANNFGSLGFSGGSVAIAEASDTVLSGVSVAASLDLQSTGSITDDGTADVTVTGNARFESTAAPPAAITLDDTYNFGTLTFVGGAVTVVEQSGTELAGDSVAASLDLDSLGAITQSPGASLDVTGLADFAALAGGDITLDATNTFGTLTFSGGVVEITEAVGGSAPGTLLAGDSLAASLQLTSGGPIADAPGATLTVIGNAAFTSTGLLSNSITLDGLLNFGTLTFNGGVVAITEQSGTTLAGQSVADDLTLTSTTGAIADLADAQLTVTSPAGRAAFNAAESIVLADAGGDNSLEILGLGSFVAGDGREIAVGVIPATGDPADAFAFIDRLQFQVTDGNARVALDGNVTLEGVSFAADVELNAFGDGFNITDLPDSDLTFDRTAILRAAGDNIVLGDAAGLTASRFGHEADPVVFDADEFLALEAANVSIVAYTGINLRTGPEDTPFDGSFFLRAAGTIAQVGVAGLFTPLTADRVALASGGVEVDADFEGEPGIATPAGGAVLFSQITLTGDASTPNLAIEAGGSESFAGLIDGRAEFPTVDIAGGADGEFLPVNVADRTGETAFLDSVGNDQGLELLPNGQVAEPTEAFGDAFSIIAVVNGDATVGVVADATNGLPLNQADRPDQIGVEVTDSDGNVFLRTLVEPAGEEVAGEAGDLVFTSQGAASETVVRVQAGVFTAIADGVLTIDTDAPDSEAGTITTRLTSSTGTVTSVAAFDTLLGVPLDLASGLEIDPATDLITLNLTGPRFVLDPPSNAIGAATTDQVLTGESGETVPFGQTITFAIGSRGEDGLIVEFEFADVLLRRESPLDLLPVDLAGGGEFPGEVILGPGGEELFDPLADLRSNPLVDTDGTIPLPVVTLAPADLDALPLSELVTQTSDPNIEFRVVTVTHVFSEAFIQTNELVTLLPTTVRVYNDPSINLFDLGGERQLNANANFLEPDIGQTAGFFLPIPPTEPTRFPVVEPTIITPPRFAPPAATGNADLASAASSDAEVILFGRVDGVDEDDDGFADNIPGESWPLQWDGDDGDFIEQIRQLVDDGPFSEGEYRIITKSPRGEQQLEVWVKGDTAEEQTIGGEGDEQAPPAAEANEKLGAREFAEPIAPQAAKPAATPTAVVEEVAERVAEPPALVWETVATTKIDSDGESLLQTLGVGAGLVVGAAVYRHANQETDASHKRGARRRRRVQHLLNRSAKRSETEASR